MLAELAEEVEEDRGTLIDIMTGLGVTPRRYKMLLGWLAEQGGRLKPNGRLLSRIPLAELVELETMQLGVYGKAAGWRTLRARAGSDQRLDGERLGALIDRAGTQLDTLEALRARAATEAAGGPAPFERH